MSKFYFFWMAAGLSFSFLALASNKEGRAWIRDLISIILALAIGTILGPITGILFIIEMRRKK